MIAFSGNDRDQDYDVRFESGDLIVTMNGKTLIRLALPPQKVKELREAMK